MICASNVVRDSLNYGHIYSNYVGHHFSLPNNYCQQQIGVNYYALQSFLARDTNI